MQKDCQRNFIGGPVISRWFVFKRTKDSFEEDKKET